MNLRMAVGLILLSQIFVGSTLAQEKPASSSGHEAAASSPSGVPRFSGLDDREREIVERLQYQNEMMGSSRNLLFHLLKEKPAVPQLCADLGKFQEATTSLVDSLTFQIDKKRFGWLDKDSHRHVYLESHYLGRLARSLEGFCADPAEYSRFSKIDMEPGDLAELRRRVLEISSRLHMIYAELGGETTTYHDPIPYFEKEKRITAAEAKTLREQKWVDSPDGRYAIRPK